MEGGEDGGEGKKGTKGGDLGSLFLICLQYEGGDHFLKVPTLRKNFTTISNTVKKSNSIEAVLS